MLSNTAIIVIAVVIILCFLALYFFTYKTDVKGGQATGKTRQRRCCIKVAGV